MEPSDNTPQSPKTEEWEKIHEEEQSLTLDERKTLQISKLQSMLTSFHSLYGEGFIAVVKSVEKRAIAENETLAMAALPYKEELVDRINGLRDRFGDEYYRLIQVVTGVQLAPSPKPTVKKETEPVREEAPQPEVSTDREAPRAAKLPKGFNKWDLKMIKLHESHPAEEKRIWVEFWSLKGVSYVGEILYNPTKQLFYFKPYDSSNSSFALTEEQARKATTQARNYYFRVAPTPPDGF